MLLEPHRALQRLAEHERVAVELQGYKQEGGSVPHRRHCCCSLEEISASERRVRPPLASRAKTLRVPGTAPRCPQERQHRALAGLALTLHLRKQFATLAATAPGRCSRLPGSSASGSAVGQGSPASRLPHRCGRSQVRLSSRWPRRAPTSTACQIGRSGWPLAGSGAAQLSEDAWDWRTAGAGPCASRDPHCCSRWHERPAASWLPVSDSSRGCEPQQGRDRGPSAREGATPRRRRRLPL